MNVFGWWGEEEYLDPRKHEENVKNPQRKAPAQNQTSDIFAAR